MRVVREELAWAAGFFDGEGSTKSRNVKDRGHQPPLLSVAQVDLESLYRFHRAVLGCGQVRGPYGPYASNKQAFYVWQTCNIPDSIAVIGLLWHWLGSVKRRQAKAAFQLWRNKRVS